MRALLAAACLAAALGADAPGPEVVVSHSGAAPAASSSVEGDSDVPATAVMGVIAGTAELSGADDSLKTGRATAEDYLCDVAQMALQKIVEGGCGVAEVSCVYKMEGACDDWCTPSTQRGYIQDNPFMKFHDFSCSGRVSSDYVGYTVQCHPEFTVLGVLALVAVAVSALACCGGCFQFCRRRSRRRRGDY